AVRASSRPREASSTKTTRRPRRRKPRIAASSQTSVATPKTTISSGSSASRRGSAFGFVNTSKLFFRRISSRRLPTSFPSRPGGNGVSESGNGSRCFVSSTFSAPRVPRRQCGGYVLRKSGSSLISGSVSSWSSADATCTTCAARAASTSRSIAGAASRASGTYSFPFGSMKSTCVSTSQRMRPATTSLLPTARLEAHTEELQPALERGPVRPTVQLRGDEREDEVRELMVQLVRVAPREACGAQPVVQESREQLAIRARERAREERRRPRMGEEDAPGRAGDVREVGPPVAAVPASRQQLPVELVGHRVEQRVLARDVAVERHRRHAEQLGEAPQRHRLEAARVREVQGRRDDRVSVEPLHELSVQCTLVCIRCRRG